MGGAGRRSKGEGFVEHVPFRNPLPSKPPPLFEPPPPSPFNEAPWTLPPGFGDQLDPVAGDSMEILSAFDLTQLDLMLFVDLTLRAWTPAARS